MIIVLLILLLATVLYYIHWRTLRNFDRYKAINGAVGVPFLGTVYDFISDDVKQIQERTLNWFQKYGDTYTIYCSWQFIVMSSNAKVAEDLLTATNKNLEKNYLYSLLRRWLMEGLLLSVDRKWHNRRKIITPAFHFKILESFIPIFDQQGDVLVEQIKMLNLKQDVGFDIHNLIARYTLDAIAETSMGIKPQAQTSDDCIYTKAVREMSECVSERFIRFYHRNDVLCYFFNNPLLQKYNNVLKVLHDFTEKTIIERRELLQKSQSEQKNSQAEENEFGQKKRMVFLDLLLQSSIDGKPLTNLDIREEVDTFMFEGHDTTTSGICFTLCLISRHAEVQRKIYDEIMGEIGDDKIKSLGYQELNNLKYLEAVIKESMRMYPPVAILGRVITEDSVINGSVYPKGTNVVLHIQQLMRNPELFDRPNEFLPERHFNTSYFDSNPFSYIPFSAGPRNCIGQKYAMLELKSVIVKVVRHFQLLPNGPEVEPLIAIVLKSSSGFHMGFRPRV